VPERRSAAGILEERVKLHLAREASGRTWAGGRMSDTPEHEVARALPLPFEPGSLSSPTLDWGAGVLGDLVYSVTTANEHLRVAFDGLDAIRICRGEYSPYPMRA
jgi:hypothetical protein